MLDEYAIGLDIGGTKIAGGVVDCATGRVLSKQVIPTEPQRGGQAVLESTLGLTEYLLQEAHKLGVTIAGVGLGICELVDATGQITDAHTIDWRDLPVRERFALLAPVGSKIIIEADVRASAVAEARFGAGRPYSLFAYVTVGTGISCCLVQAGRPLVGARGHALVLASMPLTTTCPHCGSELHPVLEEYASGPALLARYNHAVGKPSAITHGRALMAAVAAGDPLAIEIVRSAGAALGNSVAFLVNILDPAAVIVGGGLGVAGGLYWESFVAATRAHIYADTTRTLPILPAALGEDAGLIGAGAMVYHEQAVTASSNTKAGTAEAVPAFV